MESPTQTIRMALRRPLVGACFRCWKTRHSKNECPYGGGDALCVDGKDI